MSLHKVCDCVLEVDEARGKCSSPEQYNKRWSEGHPHRVWKKEFNVSESVMSEEKFLCKGDSLGQAFPD